MYQIEGTKARSCLKGFIGENKARLKLKLYPITQSGQFYLLKNVPKMKGFFFSQNVGAFNKYELTSELFECRNAEI